jgi:RecA-family ATPase
MMCVSVSCEDDRDEWQIRAEAVATKPENAPFRDKFEENMVLFDMVGRDACLVEFTDVGARRTKHYERFDNYLSSLGDGRKLITLDTVVDIAAINENDRSQVNHLVKAVLGDLVRRHNATIAYLAHPSKSSAYSGSTAWPGASRFMITMGWHEEIEGVRVLKRYKSNYSEKDVEISLVWKNEALVRRDIEEIEEDLFALRAKGVYSMVQEYAELGSPLSRQSSSPEYVKKHTFKDSRGCKIPPDDVLKVLAQLINTGVIEEVKGEPKNNGLYPKLDEF